MRLPAVALASTFAGGAALGASNCLTTQASSRSWISIGLAVVTVVIGAGILLARALSSWLLLGFAGAGIANQPRSSDHVLELINSQRIELKTPLRWLGSGQG